MNIIERLFIEVGLDTSKMSADVAKVKRQNVELETSLEGTELAFKKAGKTTAKYSKQQQEFMQGAAELGRTINGVTKAVTGLFSAILVSTGMSKLIGDAVKANNELHFLEKNLNMNARSIKAWQVTAAASGGTAEGITTSLTAMKQAMNGLVMFGDTSMLPYFNALGVSMVDGYGRVRDMNSVMLDLADAFEQMPRDQAYTVAKQMGLDDGTINTLMQGRKELQEMLDIQKRMYQSDEQARRASRELSKERAILNAQWESMKQMLADALIPVLLKVVKIVNGFMEFLQRHRDTMMKIFAVAAAVIGMKIIPLLFKALSALKLFIAPFSPFLLVIGALATAFMLLYDDYKTWAEGGKSLFDWGAFKDGVVAVKDAVVELTQAFLDLTKPMYDALDKAAPKFTDKVGEIATVVAAGLGVQEAKDALDANINYKANGGDAAVTAPVKVRKPAQSQAGSKVATLKGSDQSGLKNGVLHLTEQDIEDLIKVTDTEVVKGLKQADFEAQTRGVVDTILNRTASGKWGTSVRSVANAHRQFTKITGPKGYRTKSGKWIANNPYGAVQNMPASAVNAKTRAYVMKYLQERENGRKSSVADNLNYANPFASDAYNRKKWVDSFYAQAKKDNMVFGSGQAVHGHGTTADLKRYKPGSFRIEAGGQSVQKGGAQARQMLADAQQRQLASSVTKNDNRRQTDVTIQSITVQSTATTLDGVNRDAVKGARDYLHNQLMSPIS